MATFSWISGLDLLGSLALTKLAQAVNPNNIDQITWPGFSPRVDVDSVRLAYIESSVDFRPVADRREWNQRGRNIPIKTPNISNVVMTPIESNYGIREEQIQRFRERAMQNQAQFQEIVGASIQAMVPKLAASNWRRIERDFYDAWALGQITVRDPQGAPDEVVNLGFAAARYLTPTAWTGALGSGGAYARLIAEYDNAVALMGSVGGVMLRTSTLAAIQSSAPQGIMAVQLTRAQLIDKIQGDLGAPFEILKNDRTSDVFVDGGASTVATNLWPAQTVAFIPGDNRIGSTYFAPVARAFDLAPNPEQVGIDVRGNTVFSETEDMGRGLLVECQVNALPVPEEQRLYVLKVGI